MMAFGEAHSNPICGKNEGAERKRALFTLVGVAAMAVVTQALSFGVRPGLAWLVFSAICIVAVFAAHRKAALGWLPSIWALAALFAATAYVVYASDWAALIARPLSVMFLATLPIVVARGIAWRELPALSGATLSAVRSVPQALRDARTLPGRACHEGLIGKLRPILVGIAVGLPISALFMILLSADPGFAELLTATLERSFDTVDFVFWSAVSMSGYLVFHLAVLRSSERGLHVDKEQSDPGPYRRSMLCPLPVIRCSRSLSPTTWAVVLAQGVCIFGAFAVLTLPQLFQGHDFLQRAGTPTYARYLHAGFMQVSLATLLSVLLVIAGHWLVARTDAAESAPRTSGFVRLLELGLLGLTAIALLSCLQRLRLYEEAYGATYLRLLVGFFQVGVGALLCLTAVQSVRRNWSFYPSAVTASMLVLALSAACFNADLYIAERNLARLARTDVSMVPLDVDYLASLSDDAASIVAHPYFGAHPDARDQLLAAYCARIERRSDQGWRALRGLATLNRSELCSAPRRALH